MHVYINPKIVMLFFSSMACAHVHWDPHFYDGDYNNVVPDLIRCFSKTPQAAHVFREGLLYMEYGVNDSMPKWIKRYLARSPIIQPRLNALYVTVEQVGPEYHVTSLRRGFASSNRVVVSVLYGDGKSEKFVRRMPSQVPVVRISSRVSTSI